MLWDWPWLKLLIIIDQDAKHSEGRGREYLTSQTLMIVGSCTYHGGI